MEGESVTARLCFGFLWLSSDTAATVFLQLGEEEEEKEEDCVAMPWARMSRQRLYSNSNNQRKIIFKGVGEENYLRG